MAALIEVFAYLSLGLFTASAFIYFISIKKSSLFGAGFRLALAGFIFSLLSFLLLTIINGRLPVASGYEFLMSFSLITVLIFLVYEARSQPSGAGGPVMLIASLLSLTMILLQSGQAGTAAPIMPALKSPWLTVHVLIAAAAYSTFAWAAGLAVVNLSESTSKRDESVYRAVSIGFALLTLSIVLGAIWAEQAWGSYWTWDPKEIWALITWIIYALYLHLHKQQRWRGKAGRLLVIGGFLLVLFTFFGVNYLMSGLHSYA